MDVTVTSAFCFFLLILPQISWQQICTPPPRVNIEENNKVGDTVAEVLLEPDTTLEFKTNPNDSFTLEGNLIKAAVVFDYEKDKTFSIEITCSQPGEPQLNDEITVIVTDVNDNPPVFEKSLYEVEINELSPPGTLVDTFAAHDADLSTKLYYTLTPENVGFSLQPDGVRDVRILTTKSFNYDTDKSIQLLLYVQDTPLGRNETPSHNTTTTINVTIADIDNRPPWFKPCKELEMSGTTVCVSEQSYTGSVYLNEQQTGALTLKPNQILAVDGDSGQNESIVYSILSGNGDGAFAINNSTGDITMVKPITTVGTITLTVLAAQKVNVHQVATTAVSIGVFVRSTHKPEFTSPLYEGVITDVGVMAKNKSDMGQLLRITAKDADYGEAENPGIIYSVIGNNAFALSGGYLFMTTRVDDGTYELDVRAVDSVTDESAETKVSVEVESGPTSTPGGETPDVTPAVSSLSPGTTNSGATPTSTESTSIPGVSTPNETITGVTPENTPPSGNTSVSTPVPTTMTGEIPGSTTPSGNTSVSTPVPTTITGEISRSTTPSVTSSNSTGTTADGMVTSSDSSAVSTPYPTPTDDDAAQTSNTQPSTGGAGGGFDSTDMAALGATLGVLLFLALVIMGILFFRLRRDKKDWKKIHESNVFRSSLGQKSGGAKEGIQYTNKAFDNDEDNDSRGSGNPVNGVVLSNHADARDYSKYESIMEPKLPPQGDDSSQSGSEKEVKPILTKERKVEEGYKAVWFKEDIDQDAKDEVVIIPDSREHDSDRDEDSSSDKESGDESPRRRSRVMFSNFVDEKGGEVLSVDL